MQHERPTNVGNRFGDYRVLSVLGEGGMGVVYLAEHERLGRRVAIKQLKPRYAAEPDLLRRFFDESCAIRKLKHPHIASVSDVVTGAQGALCIMEYLEGRTLADELRLRGRMPVRRALRLASQVADALEAAHGEGIIHRDVKPSNIHLQLTDGGPEQAKLFDFGVAKLANDGDSASTSRRLASLLTPPYMAPEQSANGDTDARTDVYGLGAVLYEMMRGTPPFKASSFAEYVYKHATVMPAPPASIFSRVRRVQRDASRVALRCLAKNPGDRYQSAAELRAALRSAGG